MSQFSLNDHPCKVDSYNSRAEKSGQENVPAADLKLVTRLHSSALDQFDRSYRPFLFRQADPLSAQPSLMDGDTLVSLAKPNLRPLSIDEKFPGYTMRIGIGAGIASPLVVTEVSLSAFKIEAIEGGSVAITFNASFHPDEHIAGVLGVSVMKTLMVTLEPPGEHPQAQMDLGGEGDTLDQQEAAETADAAADAEA